MPKRCISYQLFLINFLSDLVFAFTFTEMMNFRVDRPEIKCIEMNLSGLTLKVDEAMQPKVESARQ